MYMEAYSSVSHSVTAVTLDHFNGITWGNSAQPFSHVRVSHTPRYPQLDSNKLPPNTTNTARPHICFSSCGLSHRCPHPSLTHLTTILFFPSCAAVPIMWKWWSCWCSCIWTYINLGRKSQWLFESCYCEDYGDDVMMMMVMILPQHVCGHLEAWALMPTTAQCHWQ